MKVKFPKFKTKEEIPATFLELYTEKDGEWVVEVEEEEAERPSDRLQKALKAERERAEKAEKDLRIAREEAERASKDKEFGIDSEKAKQWREEQYKLIRAEVQKDIDALTKERDEARGEARSLSLDTKVKALALKAGVMPDRVEDWWALNHGQFDLDENKEPVVKDGKGKAIDQYIATDLKKAKPYLYTGSAAGGGGGGGDRTKLGSGGISTAEEVLANPSEALRRARESGDKGAGVV